MSDNTNLCVIDAKNGMDGANIEISQFTQNINNIKFTIDYDFTDLSCFIVADIEGKIELLYEDGENLKKEYDVESKKTYLTWNIGRQFTYQSGVLLYQIVAYKDTNSAWYSKEGRIIVTKSIDTNSYSVEQIGAYPNLLTRLIASFDSFKTEFEASLLTKVDKEDGKTLTDENYTKEEKEKLSEIVYIPHSLSVDELSDDNTLPTSKAVYTFVGNSLQKFLQSDISLKISTMIDENTLNVTSVLIDDKIRLSLDNEIKEKINLSINDYDKNTLPQKVNSIIDGKINNEIASLIDTKISNETTILNERINQTNDMISDKISENNTNLLENVIPDMISSYVDNAINESIDEALEGDY